MFLVDGLARQLQPEDESQVFSSSPLSGQSPPKNHPCIQAVHSDLAAYLR